jgi:hypothetical protein
MSISINIIQKRCFERKIRALYVPQGRRVCEGKKFFAPTPNLHNSRFHLSLDACPQGDPCRGKKFFAPTPNGLFRQFEMHPIYFASLKIILHILFAIPFFTIIQKIFQHFFECIKTF